MDGGKLKVNISDPGVPCGTIGLGIWVGDGE